MRSLAMAEGELIVERLEAFSNRDRSYSYSFISAPFPARDYLATLQVREIAGRQASLAVWSGSFLVDGVSDDAVTSLFHGIYRAGLEALAQRLQAD